MIEIIWHGRGGQGSFTASRLLGLSAGLYEKKYAIAFPTFGPERRGAPVLGFTKIDSQNITDRSEVQKSDYTIILDETLIDNNTGNELKPAGTLIINSGYPEKYNFAANIKTIFIDANDIAYKILGRQIVNTAMLGTLVAVSNVISIESAESGIRHEMKSNIAEKNVELLKFAYESTLKLYQ
ncbi:MAG: 2-oxoacid:acceptor oxidoreductase family protein [Ignavibacteriaceae bacterium]|jgi:pyruvate ferredoxin oxidoreductase gamma subunit